MRCWKHQGLAVQKVWLGQHGVPGEKMEMFSAAFPPFSSPTVLHPWASPSSQILEELKGCLCTSGAEPAVPKLLGVGGCTCSCISIPVQEGS